MIGPMQPFPPSKPTKKGAGSPTTRRSADPLSSLFSTGSRPSAAPSRAERSARLASDLKRGLFFAAILVFVGIVLYQFVSAL
jgi:hypothetical protein